MTSAALPDHVTDPFFGLEDRWLETADNELTHYHAVGAGPAALFLHGSGTGVTAAANWWLNLPAIAAGARCIAIDMIGYGQTVVAPEIGFGVREWAAHAIRVLDALGIEKSWIVGNSLGGWIALQLTIEHPERLLGVVSMGTGGGPANAALKGLINTQLTEAGVRQTLELFVEDKSIVTDELVSLRLATAQNDSASERLQEVVAARERDRREVPLDNEALSRLQLPVLLVHGIQDRIIPVGRTHELLDVIPTADAHLFNRCGHWSQVERADDFNDLVVSFIGNNSDSLTSS